MYYNNWTNKEEMAGSFEIDVKELEDIHVLFASYGYESYEGDAIVVFMKDGKLYEVHGSHCSCNGLEGQWRPEETTVEAITERYKTEGGWSYMSSAHGDDAATNLMRGLTGAIFEKIVLEPEEKVIH